jgi:hypothetical protein
VLKGKRAQRSATIKYEQSASAVSGCDKDRFAAHAFSVPRRRGSQRITCRQDVSTTGRTDFSKMENLFELWLEAYQRLPRLGIVICDPLFDPRSN